jgi:peptidoglycan/xylan/chitin deacetylase (PgdA/CDA1 family)
MASRGFVLTFHSHNIAGNDYATNDHVALDATLAHLARAGVPVLRLLDVAKRLRAGRLESLPARFACITFDDGTDYDWRDLAHPQHGAQRSMHAILRAHSRRLLGLVWQRRAHATSFVIASPLARAEISAAALGDRGLMSDGWWRAAQRSGLMDIGTHGWNHVHPAASEMQAQPALIERFDRVETPGEAALQVDRAFDAIHATAGGDAGRVFAYPYGQVSEYLATRHLPAQRHIVAAVSVEPAPVHAGSDPWRIPRYVCGHDWKDEAGLDAILRAA